MVVRVKFLRSLDLDMMDQNIIIVVAIIITLAPSADLQILGSPEKSSAVRVGAMRRSSSEPQVNTSTCRAWTLALAQDLVQELAWGVRQNTAQDCALGSARRWARSDCRPGRGKRGRQRSIVMYDVSDHMEARKCAI